MAILIPPPPRGGDESIQQDWFIRIRNAINKLGSSITWAILDKTGSKLTDIETRNHSNLQNIQGGSSTEHYHLTAAEYAALGSSGGASFITTEIDLGTKPKSNGSFTITSSGLTTGKVVLINQAALAYTGKGTYTDEIEMDQITVSGNVVDATTINCNWGCNTLVAGNVKFNYLVST